MDKRSSIEGIINKFTVKINQGEANDQLIASLIFLGKREDYCRSYPEISDIIYHLEDKKFYNLKGNFALLDEITENKFEGLLGDEKIAPFPDNEIKKEPNQKKENEKRKKINSNLLRFERHIQLSCYQRDYILSQTSDAEHVASTANQVSLEAEEVAKNAKNKVGHIYSEFVGILAIFTAMSFAMMGSVQVLGNLFHDVKLWGPKSIGYALVIGGIYIIIMYLIIVILLVGVKKLYGNDVKNNNYKFTPQIVMTVISVSLIMIVAGVVLIFMK